jgi:hypothetical protein
MRVSFSGTSWLEILPASALRGSHRPATHYPASLTCLLQAPMFMPSYRHAVIGSLLRGKMVLTRLQIQEDVHRWAQLGNDRP